MTGEGLMDIIILLTLWTLHKRQWLYQTPHIDTWTRYGIVYVCVTVHFGTPMDIPNNT